jgi:hypothetical protein
MLWHIRPRLYSPFENVALIDLKIEPLGFFLIGGQDLVTRRPYPNKHYAVACRKQGQKAINGILIETLRPEAEIVVTARWAIEAEKAVTHEVHYTLLDRDFDAASDDMMLWYACGAELGGWSSRWPERFKGVAPVSVEPVMELLPRRSRSRDAEDVLDGTGEWIVGRRETFAMPTLEPERITDSRLCDRMPRLASAFHI